MKARILLALVLLGMTAFAEECAFSAADKKRVLTLPSRYVSGWLGADAENSVMALMATDAIILPANGTEPKRGTAEIRGFWFPKNAPKFEILRLTMDPSDAMGCGPIAYIWGKQALEWKMADKPQITVQGGTFLMVVRKLKGEWKIQSYMWDDPPSTTR